MSLINYVEPFSFGDALAGVAVLIMVCVMSFIFVRIYIRLAHWLDSIVDKDIKYSILEQKMLEDFAKDKGIDLELEMTKRKLKLINVKSFRRKLEEETYNRMFPEDSKKSSK